MIKKRRLLYIGVVAIFALYLFFATDIVCASQGIPVNLTAITNDLSSMAKDKVHYAADVRVTENWLDQILIEGWAFCQTSDNNDGKTVSIILQSEQAAFELQGDVLMRIDVKSVFQELTDKNNHGFATEFSAAKLPYGVYSIIIKVIENNQNYGVVQVPDKIIKDRNGCRIYNFTKDYKAEVVTLDLSLASSNGFQRGISNPYVEDGFLMVDGWGVVEGEDSASQKLFVQIVDIEGKSTLYSTDPVSRGDVVNHFGNQRYLESGFRTKIPVENILWGDKGVAIGVVAELNGQLYYQQPVLMPLGTR